MEERSKPKGHDVVLLQAPTDKGDGLRALRSRPGRLDLAELRPVREGRPLGSAELVRLHPREESPLLWNVEVQYSPEEPLADSVHEGPARVSSSAYRRNWDEVFGAKEIARSRAPGGKRLLN